MIKESPKDSDRRHFLKSLPHQVVKGVRAVAGGGFLPSLTEIESNTDPEQAQEPSVARIDVAKCHAWAGLSCQLCYLACPKRDQAIEMRDQKPVIIASGCDGCAMCDVACRTVNDISAVAMVSR
jgi:Pyruvate/2-oxoacid:ferredoxin oxidoreductase delta subunit